MAISISISSNLYYMVKNPMLVRVTTNRYIVTAGTKAKVILSFSGTGAASGQGILFVTQSGISVSMEFATALNDSGTKLRTNTTALSLPDFIQQVAADLATNYYLQENYKITYGIASITLEAKNIGDDLTTVCFSTATGITVSSMTPGINQVTADNHRIRMDVYAETSYHSNTFNKIGSIEEEPFQNYADFDISELLRWNFTKCDLPDYMELDVIRCRFALTRYFIVTAEKYGNPPQLKLADTSDKYLAFFGGISYQEFPYQTLLYDHIWDTQKYLTWQPTTKDAYVDSQDYLYFMIPRDETDFRVRYDVFYTDGTNDTVYAFPRTGVPYEIYRIPTGYRQLLLTGVIFDPAKTVSCYDVYVDDTVATILAEAVRYKMNYRNRFEKQLFIFSNSLAAMETLETTGELVTGIAVEAFTAETATQYSYAVVDGESFKTYAEKQDVFKISTGWMSKARANQVIDELFLAEFVYIADPKKNQWLPVIINKATVEKFKSLQDLIAVNFEFAYAFTNRVIEGDITSNTLSNMFITIGPSTEILTTSSSQIIQINNNYNQQQ